MDTPPGEITSAQAGLHMALKPMIEDGRKNVLQVLNGIVQRACIWAWPNAGLEFEQS
jgi:hypothetical protein